MKKLIPKLLTHYLIPMCLFMALAFNVSAQNCQALVYSGSDDWYPVSYLDANNGSRGHAIQQAQAIAEHLQVDLKVVKGLPWQRQLQLLESGNIHFIAGYFNQQRATRFKYSPAFAKEAVSIFLRKDVPDNIQQVSDLSALVGGRPRAASLGDEFDRFSRGNPRVFQGLKIKNLFNMMIADRLDYIVVAKANGERAIRELKIADKVKLSKYTVAENSIYLMFTRKPDCNIEYQKIFDFIEVANNQNDLAELKSGNQNTE